MSHTIALADADRDQAAILELWRRNLPHATAERYEWLYRIGSARCWLARSSNGTVLGAAGLMPRRLRLGDAPAYAGHAIDLNVDRQQRILGLALQLERTVVESARADPLAFIYGLPGPPASAVCRRLGFQEVGPVERWIKPLAAAYLLRKYVKHPLATRVTSWVASPFLRWRFGEKGRLQHGSAASETAAHFDDRFDVLWLRAAASFGVLCERGAAYLHWRFGKCPGPAYRVFCTANDRDLLGYIVFRQDSAHLVHVDDFLFRDPAAGEQLFLAFFHAMRQARASALCLNFLGAKEVERLLESLGFARRVSEDRLYVYPGAGDFMQPERWFLTRADLDTGG